MKDMAAQVLFDLQDRMRSSPYTLSTDGSNDVEAKHFPLVIRTVNADSGLVTSEVLSVPICEGSATGENIFNLIQVEFQARRIPWRNCLSLGCDNANVMTGRHKGVFAFMKEQQPQIFLAGCTLHIVHNAAKKAATHMPPFEAVLVDIFHFFDKSCERKGRFQQMQALFDVEHKKVIKHVPTRWLSISRCLQRLLEHWDALKVFFSEEKESLKKKSASSSYAVSNVHTIFEFVWSPTNKLYLLFLLHSVSAFNEFLLVYQSEAPHIHKLRRGMEKMLTGIMSRLVKPAARRGKSILDVDFQNPENIYSNEDLGIGEDARRFIENKDSNHLRDSRIPEFFVSVRKYFVELVGHLKSRLPLSDPLLQHAEVADVNLQDSSSLQSVRFFLNRFPCLLPPGTDVNTVLQQFSEYQGTDVSKMKAEREDETWLNISRITENDANFQHLSLVMRGILTIPHGSAHCERIFSCVRKIKRPERSCLSDDTLESILILKSSSLGPVEAVRKMTSEQLDAIKRAYAKSLKKV